MGLVAVRFLLWQGNEAPDAGKEGPLPTLLNRWPW
jgi:hypothetical protein